MTKAVLVGFPSWDFLKFASGDSRKPCDRGKPDRELCMVAVNATVEDSRTSRFPKKASTRRKDEAILVPSSWLVSDTLTKE